MKNTWKKAAAVVAFAGIALSATACSNSKTVVSYKGGKITQEEYYNKMKKSAAGQSELASMIVNDALEEQYGKYVTDKQVNKEFNQSKKQYGSQFSTALQQQGLTESTYKESIKTNLLMNQALRHIKKISKKQEEKAWKSYQPKVQVEHILVSKESTAKDIINQLNNGAKFETLAKKYSTDSETKNDGGKLPKFDSSDTSLDSTFKNAAFKLNKGEYTKTPVKTEYGYHIIKMISKPSKGSFKDHKKEIDNQIYAKMAQDQTTMQSVLATVLKRADVSIKDNDLKDVLTKYITPDAK
ncbi:peptidylprolyl isomerase PrsA [Lactobacillus sp. PV034]|uniref:peptidylprolyl isomerase PrsA n=1 Tax=Lactobacillus sp. PV034 TaxID=2594495 RepID=UPI00223EC8E3|nr:peptidylprolyl isomerase PrsA [Lactobacillus sp. PV034]QNQ80105.1 peptidylprolyl isomerase [Lactobacillus sp. PV034]